MNEIRKDHIEDEIDLLDLARKLLRYWWIMLLALLIGAGGAAGYTLKMVTPMYRAECMIYVNNGAISLGSTTVSLTDLNASKSLVDTYMVILKSRNVLMDVAEKMGVDYSYDKMSSMVSAGKVSDTEVFRIYVVSADPAEAEAMANTIAEVLPEKITEIIEGSSVKIVDYAVVPSRQISPNVKKNIAMGGMALFILAAGILTLFILLDNTIQNETDIYGFTKLPILTKVPEHTEEEGDALPLSVNEAYHLLKINVRYSIPQTGKGKIIGITSSVASEYKSTTAINLALNLAGDHDAKVLLLDCDLRMSDIGKRMNLGKRAGLTEYLTSDIDLDSIIVHPEKCPELHVVVSGGASPNPGELLNSEKMKLCLETLAEKFDYIICDFPPANIVSDALAVGTCCDGMLIVARQKYTVKSSLEEAIGKLEFLSINVLGIVFTGVNQHKTYGKKYYYSKYYGKYKQK